MVFVLVALLNKRKEPCLAQQPGPMASANQETFTMQPKKSAVDKAAHGMETSSGGIWVQEGATGWDWESACVRYIFLCFLLQLPPMRAFVRNA